MDKKRKEIRIGYAPKTVNLHWKYSDFEGGLCLEYGVVVKRKIKSYKKVRITIEEL